jgi:hypothetical protein
MTPPQARAPLSPDRREMEAFAAHVGLLTRTPAESLTRRWEAEWWNGPTRPVRDYDSEDALIADLHRLFGRPKASPRTKKR